jgi:hypothetical protein
MPDFGEIQWEVRESQAKYDDKHPAEGAESFEFFLNYCKAKLPAQDLAKAYHLFSEERSRLNEEVKKSIEVLAQQPFLAAFLVWIKEIALHPPERLAAKALLEKGFIGITDKDGHVWTLANAKLFDHRNVIEAIRCHKEWSFPLRENLVKTYLDFMQWLWTTTWGYIHKLEDPDLARSQARSLAYSNFINFLSKLKDEDQLVAKLLYFGGSRTLEEVLTLHIENVDFTKRLVNFGLQPVTYPLHVFADIKDLSQQRKKGKVFIGRRGKGTALNPATIFRNFKEAALEIGLDQNFTPKALTVNI